jgi:hypothetical protein
VRAVNDFPDPVTASAWAAEPDQVATKACPPSLSNCAVEGVHNHCRRAGTLDAHRIGCERVHRRSPGPHLREDHETARCLGRRRKPQSDGCAADRGAQAVDSQRSEQSAGHVTALTRGTFECQKS